MGEVKLRMQRAVELSLVRASLGRSNVGVVPGHDVRTEAQRWHVILRSRNEDSYIGS